MSYSAAHQSELQDMTMVVAHRQESGRGQRGNSWESAPGRNLTVTLFHRPVEAAAGTEMAPQSAEMSTGSEMAPQELAVSSAGRVQHVHLTLAERQFRISMATALGVADTLGRFGIPAMVKWANDVYIGDRKACGILIEHTVMGSRIENSRIGIGLNVNQTVFLSDAPNPVSMCQAAGHEFELAVVLETLSECLEARLSQPFDIIYSDFRKTLWRHDGAFHAFRMRQGDRERFEACIRDVRSDGPLVLVTPQGDERSFYFKEIEFIL